MTHEDDYAVRVKHVHDVIQNELERQYHIVCIHPNTGEVVPLPKGSKVWIIRTDPSMPRELWEAGLAALSAYAEALDEVCPKVASDIRKHVQLQRTAREAFNNNRAELATHPGAKLQGDES